MGQKVNPHGLRVGVIKDWDSRWYASEEKVGDLIVEDQKIRKYLKKTLYGAGVPKIEIERSNDIVTIYLHCARPGVVIGKGGEQIEQYRLAVEKMIGKKVKLNIVEVRNPDMNAQLVAENIAQQLEKRISHRRAMKNSMARAMRAGEVEGESYYFVDKERFEEMIAAGELLKLGVDISAMTRRLYRTQPMNRVKLTRIAYNKLRFMFDQQVGVIDFDKHDFEETGCTFGQADGLVNKALEVEGVRMAVLASEREDGIKMSLRAVEPDTVNDIAVLFGGGGHAQAAGCTIHAPLQEALDQMLAAMKDKLDKTPRPEKRA